MGEESSPPRVEVRPELRGWDPTAYLSKCLFAGWMVRSREERGS